MAKGPTETGSMLGIEAADICREVQSTKSGMKNKCLGSIKAVVTCKYFLDRSDRSFEEQIVPFSKEKVLEIGVNDESLLSREHGE